MAEIVPFDPDVHMEELYQLNIETITWHWEELLKNHQVDFLEILGYKTIREYTDRDFEEFSSLKPPEGITYLVVVDGEVAGMGLLKKESDDIGGLYRMYTRPQYRRRGYARLILNKLMEAGREMGYSTFWLRTPKFSFAPHLYRSFGFKEKEYPENMRLHPELQPYWFFMEKNE